MSLAPEPCWCSYCDDFYDNILNYNHMSDEIYTEIVDASEHKQDTMHDPVTQYILTIKSGELAILENYTRSGTYQEYIFRVKNLNRIYSVRNKSKGLQYVILSMLEGESIVILFETYEEAKECQDYLLSIIEKFDNDMHEM